MSAPSSKKVSRRVPATGASTSNVALSVSMFASGCPCSTVLFGATTHSTRMQLSTDCPCRGMMTGVAMSTPYALKR